MDSPLPVGSAFSERSDCVRQINMTRQVVAESDDRLMQIDAVIVLHDSVDQALCHRRDTHGC